MDHAFIDSFRGCKLHGNFILDLHPFVKLNLVLALTTAGAVLGQFWPRITAIALYFVLAVASGIWNSFQKLFFPVAGLLALFIIGARAAFHPGQTPLWDWWIIRITWEGTLYGIHFALLVIQICGAVMLYYHITPMKDLMYALEMLGVSHSASYIMLASLQEIINLGRSAQVIMESQSARGVETTGKITTRLKAFFPILGPLFLSAISNTEEKNIAMDTRAFSAPGKPTHLYELRRATKGQILFCILLNGCLAACLAWRFML